MPTCSTAGGLLAPAAEVGDARWRELIEAHHAAVRAQLDRFRGREIDRRRRVPGLVRRPTPLKGIPEPWRLYRVR
jgi:hypothetical protein